MRILASACVVVALGGGCGDSLLVSTVFVTVHADLAPFANRNGNELRIIAHGDDEEIVDDIDVTCPVGIELINFEDEIAFSRCRDTATVDARILAADACVAHAPVDAPILASTSARVGLPCGVNENLSHATMDLTIPLP
ncbi:MAG TPA: hypothetical protein VGO62_05410 [Myxococcota bacterium]